MMVLAEPAADPIPPLNTKGDVYKTEGENDPLIYDSTVGEKKAIMVYVDFPDAEMGIDTKKRGEQALGGDTFETIFREQSYGRLTIDVEHIHGWRRLPEESKEYGTKTTEDHRELFIEIFKLYPEVNFLEYDYIMANTPRLGNTAFGERDDKAIPYRGKKIRVALNLASQTPYVLAHETGHLMGLPDLYTYGGTEGPRNPAGPWDIMSEARRSTGFIGWHRHKFKWLDANRKVYLTEGTHKFTLASLHQDRGLSMIVVPVDDPKRPSKVFVIEVAQPIRVAEKDMPKPGGILIYSVDATLPTGKNPLVVYPRKDKIKAAFHLGDAFEHEDAPMTVKVIDKTAAGEYMIEVTVKKSESSNP